MAAHWVRWEQFAVLWEYTWNQACEEVVTSWEESGRRFDRFPGNLETAQQLDPLNPRLWIEGG
jgi:hypothetical protein